MRTQVLGLFALLAALSSSVPILALAAPAPNPVSKFLQESYKTPDVKLNKSYIKAVFSDATLNNKAEMNSTISNTNSTQALQCPNDTFCLQVLRPDADNLSNLYYFAADADDSQTFTGSGSCNPQVGNTSSDVSCKFNFFVTSPIAIYVAQDSYTNVTTYANITPANKKLIDLSKCTFNGVTASNDGTSGAMTITNPTPNTLYRLTLSGTGSNFDSMTCTLTAISS